MNKAMTKVLPHPSAINSNVYYLDRTEPELAEINGLENKRHFLQFYCTVTYTDFLEFNSSPF